MKREEYAPIRPLFEQGLISHFRDIFQYIALSVFVADLGKKPKRFKELIERVDQFTLEEIVLMGGLIHLSLNEMIQLIIQDYPVVAPPPEEKHSLYKAVRAMYRQGKIESFSDIFKYIKVSIVAKDVKKNRSGLSKSIKISGIKKIPLGQLVAIGNLCELTLTETLKLVEAEYVKQTQQKSLSSE